MWAHESTILTASSKIIEKPCHIKMRVIEGEMGVDLRHTYSYTLLATTKILDIVGDLQREKNKMMEWGE